MSIKSSSSGPSGVRRIRSMVWDHFTIIPKYDPNKPRVACNYCGADYACDMKANDTKPMKYHVEH